MPLVAPAVCVTITCLLGIAAVMLGAIFTTHVQVGFFMNRFGGQPGEGFEYHLLVLALPLVVRGAGALSIDAALAERLRSGAPSTLQPSRA